VDRRFAAQALKLQLSNEPYRRLFERSLAVVYRATLDGRILDWNDACAKILGYASRRESLSQFPHEVYLTSVDPDAFLSTLKEQKVLTNFERRLRRADDSPVWVLENATLIEHGEDSPSIVEGFLLDITERKRAETELGEANALLEARQREIEQDLRLAARVQESLAPHNLTWDGGSVVTFYQPVRTIGGDFGLVGADAVELRVMVGDVSGHGIGSALVANRIYTEMTGQIQRGGELATMLRHLNTFVMHIGGDGDFFLTRPPRASNERGTFWNLRALVIPRR
jgi:PAS domain S-box-containing protein